MGWWCVHSKRMWLLLCGGSSSPCSCRVRLRCKFPPVLVSCKNTHVATRVMLIHPAWMAVCGWVSVRFRWCCCCSYDPAATCACHIVPIQGALTRAVYSCMTLPALCGSALAISSAELAPCWLIGVSECVDAFQLNAILVGACNCIF
jgi:hypothetical protein